MPNITMGILVISFTLILKAVCTHALSPNPSSAVVVGGGPAGLATALVLACHHKYQVTILEEAASKEDYLQFDPSRAYFYNLNGRGQQLTRRFPKLQQQIEEEGVGIAKFERVTVPADPHEIFDPIPWSRSMSSDILDKMGTLYWIPRNLMLRILLKQVESESNITLCFGHICQQITPQNADSFLRVASQASDGKSVSHDVNLVVGADGPRSTVRGILQNNQPAAFQSYQNFNERIFRIRQWKSPSVGLRLKTLQLEPNLRIPVGDGTFVQTESVYSYAFQSINKGGRDSLSLVLLPIRDPNARRPVAVATPPSHDLWKQTTASQMKKWMVNSFPRLDFENKNQTMVTEEEWERFATSGGSRFPPCQYCSGLAIWSKSGSSGIALVGDAIHAFPPDMGQGVNMALQDVAVLDDCLANSSSLAEALENYEKERRGETKAVVRMCRFAAPFQYGQPSLGVKIRKGFWFMNIALRMALNRISRGLSPNPGIIAMMDPKLSFETIMKRADRLTISLWTSLVVVLAKIFLL